MLSRTANSIFRNAKPNILTSGARRAMGTLEESPSAHAAWQKSCYFQMDFTIPDTSTVYEAIQKFAAYDIGCLVTTDANGDISGVISERDYISKVALLGRKSKELMVKDISTKTANLMTATPSDSIDTCMTKMITKDIRHLPLLNEDGKVIGMLSVKDLVKELVSEKDKTIKILSDFATGKGGYFGSE